MLLFFPPADRRMHVTMETGGPTHRAHCINQTQLVDVSFAFLLLQDT